MDKTRDASTRRNTGVNNSTRQVSSSDNKNSHIKDSNINMNKKAKPMDKAKVLIQDWIANSRQYDHTCAVC